MAQRTIKTGPTNSIHMHQENLSSVAFSPDGKSLAVSSTTGQAFLLTDTGEVR